MTASEVLEAERHLDHIVATVRAGLAGSILLSEAVERVKVRAVAADAAIRPFRSRVVA
jgi:hypothetical protein